MTESEVESSALNSHWISESGKVFCESVRKPANTCVLLASVWRPGCRTTSAPSSNEMPTLPCFTITIVMEPCWITDSVSDTLPVYEKYALSAGGQGKEGGRQGRGGW